MTPDEVAQMSTEEELVFVAGHKAIKGIKLRYYEKPYFTKRINNNPQPTLSDPITVVENYDQLFAIHAADTKEREEKIATVQAAKAKRAGKKQNTNEERSKKEVISLVKEKAADNTGVKKTGNQPTADNPDEKEPVVYEGPRSPRAEKMRSHRDLRKPDARPGNDFTQRRSASFAGMPPTADRPQPGWGHLPEPSGVEPIEARMEVPTVPEEPVRQPIPKPAAVSPNRVEYHHIPLKKENDPEIEELTKVVDETTQAIEAAEKPKEPEKEVPVIKNPMDMFNLQVDEIKSPNGGVTDDQEE
jgi:hypothetical protein